MADFKEKGIFIWNVGDIDRGDPAKIVAHLKDARFEAVYLHWQVLTSWRSKFPIALINELKKNKITIYGSASVYGDNSTSEGHQAGAIVNEFDLAGFVFEGQTAFDSKIDAPTNANKLFTAYQSMTNRPSAWRWWPMYESTDAVQLYHPKDVLKAAMNIADYGMPMTYWSWGNLASDAIRFLNETSLQWRLITTKPIVFVGRAYIGNDGTPNYDSVKAFESKAREILAHSVAWWNMDNALILTECWKALKELDGFADRSIDVGEDDFVKRKDFLSLDRRVKDLERWRKS